MNAPLKTPTSSILIAELDTILDQLIAEELESELEDNQKGVISLYYAKEHLHQINPDQDPQVLLQKWVKVLENRYFRLTDEDAGEYGSGRDALGMAISLAENRMELSPA